MAKDGFITLSRKLLEWEWFQSPHTSHLFIYMLLKAEYAPRKFQGEIIERGQFIFGRKIASAETGLSEQNIRTAMERLESCGIITNKSTNRFSIITICKYDSYQSMKKENNQPFNQQVTTEITNEQPTTNQQVTTSKEYKEVLIKEEEIIITPPGLKVVFTIQDFRKYFADSKKWREEICMKTKITDVILSQAFDTFCSDQELKQVVYPNIAKGVPHFINWLNQQIKAKKYVPEQNPADEAKRIIREGR